MMSFIATVGALVAYIQRTDGFYSSNRILFWTGQGLFALALIIIAVYTILHWNNERHFTKIRFTISLAVICLLYAIAWTDSRFSWIFILICGITEIYFTRKRAGLIKGKE